MVNNETGNTYEENKTMNEQTIKLINDLAEKLGTTSEHLWGVLVRQAPIAATWGVLELLIDAALCVLFWTLARKLSAKGVRLDDEGGNDLVIFASYSGAVVCTVVALIFTCGFVFYDLANFQMTLAGFFNPEYWAFKQIIK